MSQLLSLFGLGSGVSSGLGIGGGTSSSSTSTSGSGTTSTKQTYSPGQLSLQDLLTRTFSSMMPSVASGGMSPNVQSMETQSADLINKSYSGLGDRMSKFLAARGFGKSGQAGKVALDTELGRQGALAGNNANFAGQQLQQNNTLLSDALMEAFASMGTSGATTSTGSSDTSGSGFQIGAGFGSTVTPGKV